MTTEIIIMMTLYRKGKEKMMVRIVDFLDLTVLTSTGEQDSHIERKGLHVSLHAPTQSDRPKGDLLSRAQSHNATSPALNYVRNNHGCSAPSLNSTQLLQCHPHQAEATPRSVLQLMDVEGLTLFHVKSHLQKYRQGRHSVKEFSEPLINGISAAQGSEGPGSSMNLPPSQAKNQPKGKSKVKKEDRGSLYQKIQAQRAIHRYLHAQGSYLRIAINNACKFASNQCVEGATLENSTYYGQGFVGSGNAALLMPYFYQNQLNTSHACNSMEAVNAGISVEMPWSSFQTPTTVQAGTENSSVSVGHSTGSYLEGSKTLPRQASEGDGASYEDPVDNYLNWDDTCTNILAIDYGRFDPDRVAGTSK
ncbi:PREDICTED: protein PHR1-LIKE 1-like isoform X3 [Populus euphratica]|uniref:Protein PHR1-LIKE 1-like isoform X3 n=1 Tax=Populus euphratica TaxID=75702 RepID=A0AAJ6X7F6_POPEU|nr:PREDICTED: protein PHR1-LIKE 1-like isoform X3 [Populus euphratica]